jgi:LPS-assembly protein
MSYDQDRGLVTASGNVEIVHGQRRMRADTVTYNQTTDIVSATGNIALTEPGGERIFSDRMEVTGDLRDAVVEAVGILMTDRSRIAAVGGRYSAGTITEMRKGVYSPCELCETDPTRPPLWQVKAVKIVHDKTTKTIEYRDAWLEVFGVPVAYTPYLSHPDPTVKRKSGLLAPSFGGNSDLGLVLKVPYYFNISPTQDATLTALVTGSEGSGGIGEYRQRFMKGTLDATGSLVGGDSEEEIRGHIDAKGRFDIDDTWRLGFDAHRATDDTYLRRYGLGSPVSLNSRLFTEGFRKRNYFAANAYAFQGLRVEDDPGLEPLVLPLVDFNHVGEVDRFGGETVLDVNLLAITRTDGTDTRRLSIRPGWRLPFIGPLGDAYKVSLSLNGDFYHADELPRQGKTKLTGFSNRIVPQVTVDWRYPFVRDGATFNHVVEPIAVVAYSPNGGNSVDIPNEDSTELEFDDTNLFSANKFTGIDRVEGGPRIAYGVKWGVYGKNGGNTSFFIGQSYRPRTDDTFAAGSGLDENFSDIVGRVSINPGKYLNLLYRTRFDGDNFTPKRNEVTLAAGIPAFNVNANYVFIEKQQDSEFAGREEIVYSASSQLNRFWRIAFSGVNDLVSNETRAIGARLIYENECIVLTTDARRTFFEDRDLKPSDEISFRVVFKTLGEVRTGISP